MKDPRWLLLMMPMLCAGACRQEGEGREGPAVAKAFAPPRDGKLTARQVEMYIAVRRKALEGPAAAVGESRGVDPARLASIVTTDLETARRLGYDPDEYTWVKGKVIEARPVPADAAPPPLARAAAVSLEGLQRLREASREPGAVARVEEPVEGASAEGAREQEAAQSEARAFNEQLLARYEKELSSVEAAAARPVSKQAGPRP
jgi:hypothetical protein